MSWFQVIWQDALPLLAAYAGLIVLAVATRGGRRRGDGSAGLADGAARSDRPGLVGHVMRTVAGGSAVFLIVVGSHCLGLPRGAFRCLAEAVWAVGLLAFVVAAPAFLLLSAVEAALTRRVRHRRQARARDNGQRASSLTGLGGRP